MTKSLQQYCIDTNRSVREALQMLDALGGKAVLFVVEGDTLVGAISDGDIRRGLIRGLDLSDDLTKFATRTPKVLRKNEYSIASLRQWRREDYKIIPVVDGNARIVDVINFRLQRSYLPLHAVIMAGGIGSRLRPMTLTTPKPLLPVGGKPIMQYNVERLVSYGVEKITVTVNYLAEQIEEYFGNGEKFRTTIDYIREEEPRGTLGALAHLDPTQSEFVLVMNSDLLTTIDFEEMLAEMLKNDAAMIVGTVPYEVKVPYGVVETDGDQITGLKEKPTYTYYSNAGIYIIRREHLKSIPSSGLYNATDLMDDLISSGKRVVQFPIVDYWLDIGKPADFERAQRDIEHIKL